MRVYVARWYDSVEWAGVELDRALEYAKGEYAVDVWEGGELLGVLGYEVKV